MIYDVTYRHVQALDPSALSTITTTLHAIGRAVEDCRRAGGDPDNDAAVRLLSRHLGSVAGIGDSEAAILRRECIEAIASIRRRPVLPLLAAHGVAHDGDAKRLFHAEGHRALQRLAEALELPRTSFELRSSPGGLAISGEVTLHGEAVWVQLSIDRGPGRELLFRRVAGRRDHVGGRNHWASIDELMTPDRLAARIAGALDFAAAARPATTLLVA